MIRIDIDDPEVGGDLAGRITYRDELFTGEAVEYHPNGQQIALTTYVDGIDDGPSKEWYPDGALRGEGMTRYGRAVGEWKEWFPDGRLHRMDVFDEKGNLQARRIWNETGDVIKEYPGPEPDYSAGAGPNAQEP